MLVELPLGSIVSVDPKSAATPAGHSEHVGLLQCWLASLAVMQLQRCHF